MKYQEEILYLGVEHPGLSGKSHAHGFEVDDDGRSLPTQNVLRFYDPMASLIS